VWRNVQFEINWADLIAGAAVTALKRCIQSNRRLCGKKCSASVSLAMPNNSQARSGGKSVAQFSTGTRISHPRLWAAASFVLPARLPALMLKRLTLFLFRHRGGATAVCLSNAGVNTCGCVEYTAIEIGGKSVGTSLTSGQSALIYMFRGKRDSSNQGVRSTYIWDCKLGLNFVPA
jgi:hypothetical protein